MRNCHELSVQYKQDIALKHNAIYWQAVLNLLGESQDPCLFQGTAYQEQEALPIQEAANDNSGRFFLYLNKLILCYLFGLHCQAITHASNAKKFIEGVQGSYKVAVFYFYASLAQLAALNEVEEAKKKLFLHQVQANQKKMKKLVTPILNQGQFIGILYLENHLTAEVFTLHRLQVINLLISQAAISLEKAKLYQHLQQKEQALRSYATELKQALEELKRTQMQVVQNEKMATLGNLVAGVAHEINNPVGFISSNIAPAKEYIQDLLSLIDLYQQKFLHRDEEIEDTIEAIDLEYVRSDLPKLLESIKLGADLICNISTSLRTFSRADIDRKVPCNIHEGIDSTLFILKYRLKANEQRPTIEVTKFYGDLPLVECFPGQLNQVFMNLFTNEIDAIDEYITKHGTIVNPTPCIQIQTSVLTDKRAIKINVKDNGPGMPEETKARIFDHLFTTKPVGKGTGLGLSIARQIVEETHRGKINCTSTLGQGTEFVIYIPLEID